MEVPEKFAEIGSLSDEQRAKRKLHRGHAQYRSDEEFPYLKGWLLLGRGCKRTSGPPWEALENYVGSTKKRTNSISEQRQQHGNTSRSTLSSDSCASIARPAISGAG